MVTALVVAVVMSVLLLVVARLAFKVGHLNGTENGHAAGYRKGYETGYRNDEVYRDGLQSRIDDYDRRIERLLKRSDVLREESKQRGFKIGTLFDELNQTRQLLDQAQKNFIEAVEFVNLFKGKAEQLALFVQPLAQHGLAMAVEIDELNEEVDGLSVDLAATTHELNEAKDIINTLLMSKHGLAKFKSELSKVVAAK